MAYVVYVLLDILPQLYVNEEILNLTKYANALLDYCAVLIQFFFSIVYKSQICLKYGQIDVYRHNFF